MSVLDLINAIQAGNSQDIETHFESEMNNRIAERLDDMRAYVAKSMFNEDVDVYDYEDVITESDIEDFMQTEEFEQLDELSKKTLGNYVQKNAVSQTSLARKEDDLRRTHDTVSRAAMDTRGDASDHLYNAKKVIGKDIDKVRDKQWKRIKGMYTAVKKLTKEDVDALLENRVPAGIKLFHHDKEGKESYSIHFSAQDAQREEKRRKKMGHKTVAHSLVYGQGEKPGTYDEGERVNH